MSNTTPGTPGRLVANGLAAPWTFFVPAFILTLIAINAAGPAWWNVGEAPTTAPWANVGLFLLMAAIWYFGLARIPDMLRVRAVRTQSTKSSMVIAVRLNPAARELVVTTSRRRTSLQAAIIGAVLVVSADGCEIWGGPISDPFPVATIGWSTVEAVTVSRARFGRRTVDLAVSGQQQAAAVLVASPRPFGRTFYGAMGCQRIADYANRLRSQRSTTDSANH